MKFIIITVLLSRCYSHVGKTLNDQPLSLGAGCFKFGIIVHELGHSVGFYHEHSRSDRDEYLNIHYENIREGKMQQHSIRHDIFTI